MFDTMKKKFVRKPTGTYVHFVYNGYAWLGTVINYSNSYYDILVDEHQIDTITQCGGETVMRVHETKIY